MPFCWSLMIRSMIFVLELPSPCACHILAMALPAVSPLLTRREIKSQMFFVTAATFATTLFLTRKVLCLFVVANATSALIPQLMLCLRIWHWNCIVVTPIIDPFCGISGSCSIPCCQSVVTCGTSLQIHRVPINLP